MISLIGRATRQGSRVGELRIDHQGALVDSDQEFVQPSGLLLVARICRPVDCGADVWGAIPALTPFGSDSGRTGAA